MTMITILKGSMRTIPSDLLAAHLRHARKGNRLVIFDYSDGIVKDHFERGDAHIDIKAGNYDLIRDHQDRFSCVCAADDIIGEEDMGVIAVTAKRIIAKILLKNAELDKSVSDVIQDIRACRHEQICLSLTDIPSDDAIAHKLTWSIMQRMRKEADMFVEPDPYYCKVSASEWEGREKGSILFVSNYKYSSPVARVLHKKIANGLWIENVAELEFAGGLDWFLANRETQLDLLLPDTQTEMTKSINDVGVVIMQSAGDAMATSPVRRSASSQPTMITSERLVDDAGEASPSDLGSANSEPDMDCDWQLRQGRESSETSIDGRNEATTDDRHRYPLSLPEIVFGLLFLVTAFLGGMTFAEREPTAREIQWMDMAERRLSAEDMARTAPVASQGAR